MQDKEKYMKWNYTSRMNKYVEINQQVNSILLEIIFLLKNYFSFKRVLYCLLFSFCATISYGQSGNHLINSYLDDEITADCLQNLTHKNKKETQKLLDDFLPHKSFFQNELLKAGLSQEFCYLPLMLKKIQLENKGTFYTAGTWNLPLLVAIKYGLTVNTQIDERYDLQKSTKAAIAYLLAIEQEQKNDWDVIIAYSNSLSALKAAKTRTDNSQDIWQLYEAGNLPNKNCIPYFIAYSHLARLDAPKPVVDTTKYASIQVKKEVDIHSFTSILGIQEAAFKNANPIFIANVLPPHFDIRIPAEKEGLFIEKEDSLYVCKVAVNKIVDSLEKKNIGVIPPKKLPQYHLVQSGDMLGRIAQKYGTTVEQLKTWNGLSQDIIQPGQQLIVNMDNPSTAVTLNKPVVNTEKPVANTDKKVVYVVKKGDTLSNIAQKYNVSVSNIKKWNNLKNDNIGINQKLVILR